MCFFFLFLVVFKNFFVSPNVIENVRPQLAPILPAGAPIKDTNDEMEMVLASTDNDLLKCSKEAMYLLRFLLISFLSLISAKK